MAAKQPRVAIIHDWLVGGGAEQVVYQLHLLYPNAPIYTSYCSPEWRQKFNGKVVTGYLQNWPFSTLRKFVPMLRQRWFSKLDLSAYDIVISSTGNGEAGDVHVRQDALHVWYCHSPTHFYWRHYNEYLQRPGFGIFDSAARLGMRLFVAPLRRRDYEAAQRPALFIANSTHIQKDVKEYYGRDSVVIHPPVDVERFTAAPALERHGFVTLGRQKPYKHNDIIVQACTKLGLPLTVIGSGPDNARLRRLAGPTITFMEHASDTEVVEALASAEAFLFASHEDFGIAPVEALAAGTPVIAYKAGGALDYVTPGKTGMFFDEQTVDSLVAALRKFNAADYDHKVIVKSAQEFSAEKFRNKISKLIEEAYHAR